MRRNLESQAGLGIGRGRKGAVGLLALISLPGPVRADVVTDWNLTTLQAAAAAGLNPQRQQRVAAMVHAAVHDAVNSVAPRYKAYAVRVSPSGEASIEAAAVQAAYGVLIRLLPGQAAMLDAARSASLSQIPDGPVKEEGLAVGEAVAGQIVALRSTDGSDVDGTYIFGSGPGEYQRTPPTFGNPAVPAWRFVKPFVLKRGDQFRAEGPPSLSSDEWAADFNETKRLGSVDSTERTAEQTEIALCDAEPVAADVESGGAQRVGAETDRSGRECAAVRPAEPGHGGCHHRLLGQQVHVSVLAAGDGHPPRRYGRQRRDRGRPRLDAFAADTAPSGIPVGPLLRQHCGGQGPDQLLWQPHRLQHGHLDLPGGGGPQLRQLPGPGRRGRRLPHLHRVPLPQLHPRRRPPRPPRRPLDVPPLSATAGAPSLHGF